MPGAVTSDTDPILFKKGRIKQRKSLLIQSFLKRKGLFHGGLPTRSSTAEDYLTAQELIGSPPIVARKGVSNISYSQLPFLAVAFGDIWRGDLTEPSSLSLTSWRSNRKRSPTKNVAILATNKNTRPDEVGPRNRQGQYDRREYWNGDFEVILPG